MHGRLLSGLLLIVLFVYQSCFGAAHSLEKKSEVDAVEPFLTIKTSHPRLMLHETTAAEAKKNAAGNEQKLADYQALKRKGEEFLLAPVVVYKKGDLLEVSRTVLKRVQTLAFLYRAECDERWFNRARAELLAAAAFPNWHPEHFLDTAEMMAILAVGYDWLYDELTPSDRATISSAIVSKGLLAAKDAYDNDRYFWVKDNTTNWNIVCNSSILMAALAVGKDNPESSTLASQMASTALAHLKNGLTNYGPDGGWDEGPMYWHYATIYASRALASLDSACGQDFDLSKQPGLNETGDYILAMLGPAGKPFNYADSEADFGSAPELFWLAKKYDKDVYAWNERELLSKNRSNISALDFIWWSDAGTVADLERLKKFQYFGGRAQVATMRMLWGNPLSSFTGLVAVSNTSHHSHLGMGNFVYDALGQRFVTLLGPDDYDLPGYFDVGKGNESQRWQYYRNNSQGQNVVTFNGDSQNARAKGRIIEFSDDKSLNATYAIADLSEAYATSEVSSMRRGIALVNAMGELMVQDEFISNRPGGVVWQIHTPAKVQLLASNRALLSMGTEYVAVELFAPNEAHFEVQNVDMQAPQQPATGIKRLMVKLDPIAHPDEKTGKFAGRINVCFRPSISSNIPRAKGKHIIPLDDWKNCFKPGWQMTRGEGVEP